MTVPGFTEIGKYGRDILRSGYHYGNGIFKISITNKSDKNVQMGSNYTLNCDASKADGNTETKIDLDKFGNLKQKWSSDGTITLEYDIDGKPINGLSLTTGFSHNPSLFVNGLKFGAKFKNEMINLGCSISNALDANFRLLGAAVLGFKDLQVGYQGGYDTETARMTNNDIGLSYKYENIGIHFRGTSLPYECGGTIFYKVNDNWDTAINAIIASRDDSQHWTLGIGTRIKIDEKTTLRLKLNKDRQMGASLQQKIYDFVNVTLSLNLDFNNLPRGDHKVGLAIEIDAS